MLQITAQQLTHNPQFVSEMNTEMESYWVTDIVNQIVDEEGEASNINDCETEEGVHVLAFYWDGEYEGTVVYQVHVQSI